MQRLAVLFVLSIILSTGATAAADEAFKITDLKISAEDENTQNAKKTAVENGQLEAYAQIMQKYSFNDANNQEQTKPTAEQILSGVKSFSLKDEKITASGYSAIMEVEFDKNFIEKNLNESQKKIAEDFIPSPPVLLIPVLIKDSETYLWGEKNSFAAAWENPEISSNIVPFIIPVGDLEDVNMLTLDDVLKRKPEKLFEMSEKYGTSRVIIAEATPENNGMINLAIIEVTKRGEHFIQTSSLKPNENSDSYTSFFNSAKQVIARLEQDWKNSIITNTALPTDVNFINITVQIKSQPEWVEIRKKLESLNFLRKFSIEEFSSDSVKIVAEYSGEIEKLPALFAGENLNLSKDNDRWILIKQ